MKLISAFRAMGAAFALVLLGIFAHAAFVNDAPNGPSLGTQNVNPFTLANAIGTNTQQNFQSVTTAATTQAACTTVVGPMVLLTSPSVSSGALCLPAALAGREVMIFNQTLATPSLFGSNSPAVAGTQDSINGTTGSTAYSSLTQLKNTACFAPANGIWACNTGQ